MSASNPHPWPASVAAVYVICNPEKEKARWDRLLPHLLSCGIPRERIRVCAPTWGKDLTPDQIFAAYDPFVGRGGMPTFSFKASALTRSEISLGMNFCAAVQDAVERGDGPHIVTLESDVWLRADFVKRLEDLIASAEAATPSPSWDYISLGEGVGTRPPGAPASYYSPSRAYTPPHRWVFRCTDSMLFNLDYLQRLSKTMLPFKEIIDWEMNFQMMLNKGTPLWADPPLAEQGTWYNRIPTSLVT